MATLTGGDVLVETLAREGIKHVFSIPGGQLITIYDSINEHPGVELICPRHEGAGALMAAGYAMATGKPSVVMSTVGAGVIYEAGGLLLAWRERLPVISIAPQVQSWRMKPIQESLQSCDQDEIFRPFTKFRAIVYHYDRIPQLTRRALRVAAAPEPGPAHLDLPVDVLFGFKRVTGKKRKKLFAPGVHRFEGEVMPDEKALDKVVELIRSSKKPIALIGRGVERARAGEELLRLLNSAAIPALTSISAFASLPVDFERRLAPAELWNHEDALDTAAASDLLVIFEADEATARLAQELKRRNPDSKVAQAAALAASIDSIVPVDAGLVGTPRAVLSSLAERLLAADAPGEIDAEWVERMAAIKDRLEDRRLEAIGKGPRLDGIMGAIEVVNEIKAAKPESQVFLVSEASLIKRHSRELQTQRRYKLAITAFLFQDKDKKPGHEVDFAALAKSLGVFARSVIEPTEEITEAEVKESLTKETGMLFDATD
jgi:thiamine pyrophosphate-dependent acetolactate synthase large subunit-like protein